MEENLLCVENLVTGFFSETGLVQVVDKVSFNVKKGEILGIVGESGCGKSVTSMSIMRLIPETQGKISSGSILFEGNNLLKMNKKDFSRIAGKDISMIFQEPLSSLNPLLTCGFQIVESLRYHEKLNKKEAWAKAIELLRIVGIPLPEKRAKEYPHQLSGGMRQRVMIAMAIACNPKLLIADEPTTALDVTIQAQIIDLIKRLKRELKMSVIFITHDMGIIADVADRVLVMYAGNVIEQALVENFFSNPLHPYTRGLLKAIPRADQKKEKLYMIEGTVPDPKTPIQGCKFRDRCSCAMDICKVQKPPMIEYEQNRQVLCWLYKE